MHLCDLIISVHPDPVLLSTLLSCQLQCRLVFMFREVQSLWKMASTSLFLRSVLRLTLFSYFTFHSALCDLMVASGPQMILRQCTNDAPVAFLTNFQVECVTLLSSCPSGAPLQTQTNDLSSEVMNGQGGGCYFSTILRCVSEVFSYSVTDYLFPRSCGGECNWRRGLWLEFVHFWKQCSELYMYVYYNT